LLIIADVFLKGKNRRSQHNFCIHTA